MLPVRDRQLFVFLPRHCSFRAAKERLSSLDSWAQECSAEVCSKSPSITSSLHPTDQTHVHQKLRVKNLSAHGKWAPHPAVIRVYDEAGNVIETGDYKGDFEES